MGASGRQIPLNGSIHVSAAGIQRAQNSPFDDARCLRPQIDGLFHPGGHRHRPDAAVLAMEVDQHPAAIPLLDVFQGEIRRFGAT